MLRALLRELPGIARQIQFALKQKLIFHASCFAISCIFSLPITKRMLQNAAAYWKDVALVHKLAARVNKRYRQEQRQGNAKKQGVGRHDKTTGQMWTSRCNGARRIGAGRVVGVERL
jgi:hypothetical protein